LRASLPLLLLALASCAAAPPRSASRQAIAQIAKQLDEHPLIMIGELHRWGRLHAFLRELITDPGFICRVDDVVVEFGNSRLQKLADIYAAGGALGETEIESMWRETSVPLTWNTPVYRAVYDTIREINRRHLCAHPVRIVLADAPLD
jgi:hypothetical protein